jgi:hypothetical protein
VVIEDNTFEDCSGPNVVISSARGVTLRGNRFLRPQHDQPPDTGASYQIPNRAVVWIAESQGLELKNNETKDPGPFAAGEPVQMAPSGK